MLKDNITGWRSRMGCRRPRLPRIVVGIGLIALSVLALAAPLAAGTWSLQFLSLFPLTVGLTDLYTVSRNPALRARLVSYFSGFLAIAAAIPLFLSPALVATAVVVLLLGFLVIDGASEARAGRVGSHFAHTAVGDGRKRTLKSPARIRRLVIVAKHQRRNGDRRGCRRVYGRGGLADACVAKLRPRGSDGAGSGQCSPGPVFGSGGA